MMRCFFIFIFLTYSYLAFGQKGDVYYCSDIQGVGYYQDENYRLFRLKPYRYKVLINFDDNFMKAEDLLFNTHDRVRCDSHISKGMKYLTCTNKWGTSFQVNENNLKFKYSMIPPNETDSLLLSHGTCEKF